MGTSANAQLVREHMIRDLVANEQALKEAALRVVADFRSVLYTLALRLNGPGVQDLLRDDPAVLQSWTATQWQDFIMKSLDQTGSWRSYAGTAIPDASQKIASLQAEAEKTRQVSESHRRRAEQLQVRLSEAQQKIAQLQAQLSAVPQGRQDKKIDHKAAATPQDSKPAAAAPKKDGKAPYIGAYAGIIQQMGEWAAPTYPVRFSGRVSNDPLQWRRQSMALHFLACYGFSVRMEIDLLVGAQEGLKTRPHSLRNTLDMLGRRGLATTEVHRFRRGEGEQAFNTSLALMHLSKDGEDLCRLLGWEPVESEWQRIKRLLESECTPEHTFGILAFAMHARWRGWIAQVVPEAQGWQPDLLVKRGDQSLYVEVELNEKKNPPRWRNLDARQGSVAFCAATRAQRSQLVSNCKKMKLGGTATDLQSLVMVRAASMTPEIPLWEETWS